VPAAWGAVVEFKTGPNNLLTDVGGLRVGSSEDEHLKSGVTVVTSERPFATAVHIMGGAPGTRETDLLDPAAGAVADQLRATGRGYQVGGQYVPIVPAAIIFDLLNGGEKNWVRNPYRALGEQALDAAASSFALGSVGAGCGALTPLLKGGLGSASLQVSGTPSDVPGGPVTVAALVVVNPVGTVTVGDSAHFRAAPFERGGEFGGLGSAPADVTDRFIPPRKPWPGSVAANESTDEGNQKGENTTLAIVATDADLDVAQLKRMATAAHDGIARAISPAHTPMDGDLVFAVSTAHGHAEANVKTPQHSAKESLSVQADMNLQLLLGHAAADCVSRAIGRAVYEARPASGDLLPAWCEKFEKFGGSTGGTKNS